MADQASTALAEFGLAQQHIGRGKNRLHNIRKKCPALFLTKRERRKQYHIILWCRKSKSKARRDVTICLLLRSCLILELVTVLAIVIFVSSQMSIKPVFIAQNVFAGTIWSAAMNNCSKALLYHKMPPAAALPVRTPPDSSSKALFWHIIRPRGKTETRLPWCDTALHLHIQTSDDSRRISTLVNRVASFFWYESCLRPK